MIGILRALSSLVSPSSEEGRKTSPKATARHLAEQCTILAIDDDNSFLQVVRSALKQEGYNVLASSSGPKGLDMIRYAPSPVRVILLDYDMPRLNGSEMLGFLRRLNPHAKIIAVTGMSESFLPVEFREGVDHLIYKPFPMETLLSLIERMAQSYPAVAAAAAAE